MSQIIISTKQRQVLSALGEDNTAWFDLVALNKRTGITYPCLIKCCVNLCNNGYADSMQLNHTTVYKQLKPYDENLGGGKFKSKPITILNNNRNYGIKSNQKLTKIGEAQRKIMDYFSRNPVAVLSYTQIRTIIFKDCSIKQHTLVAALNKLNIYLEPEKRNTRKFYKLRNNNNVEFKAG